MKKVPYISLSISPMANNVLTAEQLYCILWEDDISGLAPGELLPEDNDESILKQAKELSGKTIRQYCEWRWPEHEEEQFLIVLQVLSTTGILSELEKEKYAVVYEDGSITQNLEHKKALRISTGNNKYMVPMAALKDLE